MDSLTLSKALVASNSPSKNMRFLKLSLSSIFWRQMSLNLLSFLNHIMVNGKPHVSFSDDACIYSGSCGNCISGS